MTATSKQRACRHRKNRSSIRTRKPFRGGLLGRTEVPADLATLGPTSTKQRSSSSKVNSSGSASVSTAQLKRINGQRLYFCRAAFWDECFTNANRNIIMAERRTASIKDPAAGASKRRLHQTSARRRGENVPDKQIPRESDADDANNP